MYLIDECGRLLDDGGLPVAICALDVWVWWVWSVWVWWYASMSVMSVECVGVNRTAYLRYVTHARVDNMIIKHTLSTSPLVYIDRQSKQAQHCSSRLQRRHLVIRLLQQCVAGCRGEPGNKSVYSITRRRRIVNTNETPCLLGSSHVRLIGIGICKFRVARESSSSLAKILLNPYTWYWGAEGGVVGEGGRGNIPISPTTTR